MLIYQNQQNYYKSVDSSGSNVSRHRSSKHSTQPRRRALTKKNILFLTSLGIKVKRRKKKHGRRYPKNPVTNRAK